MYGRSLIFLAMLTLFMGCGLEGEKSQLQFQATAPEKKTQDQVSPSTGDQLNTKPASGLSANPDGPQEILVDYQEIHQKVLKPRCLECHNQEFDPPFRSYQETKEFIAEIKQRSLIDQDMPPKSHLSAEEYSLLKRWIDAGAPETVQRPTTDNTAPKPDPTPTPTPSTPNTTPPINQAPKIKVQVGCTKFKNRDWRKIYKLLEKDDLIFNSWKKIEKKVEKAKENCAQSFEDPFWRSCLNNLERFVTTQRRIHEKGHSMQFLEKDSDYIQAQPKEMLSFPAGLENGLPENWQALCENKGWDCLEFYSKSLPNPPGFSFKRLLVVDENDKFDRWMLFTLPKKGTAERLIDFLAVEKGKEKALLHFAEYWRNHKGEKPKFRKNMASCYKCHPSGMKDIVPAYGSAKDGYYHLIEKLNQKMRDYGQFDWGPGTIKIEDYGPAMGKKQGCFECHNGENRGILNAAHLGERSRHQIYFKLVQDLTMPPKLQGERKYRPLFQLLEKASHLTREEIDKLYNAGRIHSIFDGLFAALGKDRGPIVANNNKLLKYLKKKKIISKAEYKLAQELLEEVEERQEKLYHEMKKDYKKTLIDWLQGDDLRCKAIF